MTTPKLLEQARALLRVKHYSIRTETAYLSWIKRYIRVQESAIPIHLKLASER